MRGGQGSRPSPVVRWGTVIGGQWSELQNSAPFPLFLCYFIKLSNFIFSYVSFFIYEKKLMSMKKSHCDIEYFGFY